MVRSSSPIAPFTQIEDSMQEQDSLSSGSEQSPGSHSEGTAHVATASLQTGATGATTRSSAAAQEQLATARAALRRRDRRIAALSCQVAALQQQLAAASGGDGKLAVYQTPGALASVGGDQADDADGAPAQQQTVRGGRLTPAVTLSTLAVATLLCWLFLV